MIDIKRVITGTEELLLEDVKLFLRVDGDGDDSLIVDLISSSRSLMESYLDRSMTGSDITLLLSPRKSFSLLYSPVGSISSISDSSGDLLYTYDGLVIVLDTYPSGSITVVYDTVSDNPAGLLLVWKQVIAYFYENRDVSMQHLLSFNTNLAPYRNKVWI